MVRRRKALNIPEFYVGKKLNPLAKSNQPPWEIFESYTPLCGLFKKNIYILLYLRTEPHDCAITSWSHHSSLYLSVKQLRGKSTPPSLSSWY